jgi:3-phenylpropionate/trans-cinnamate dioxygenase ferredoxin reductase component
MTGPGLIVIGSGPAGLGAAAAFRKHNTDLPVLLVSADPAVPYERPPLSKDFLRGETDEVALHPRSWYADHDIELVTGVEVDRVDPAGHFVVIDGHRRPYAALVLATGAKPSPLPVAGGEHALQLRSLADAERLRTASSGAQSAVVIGAGFIGCEAAASLAHRGVAVTLVAPEGVPQRERLGAEAGEQLLRLVEAAGARYVGGVSVDAVHDGPAVRLDNGVTIDCDVVLAATGVVPQSDLAEAAGLDIGQSRVVVGSDMATSAPGIFAVGDVALAYNTSAGRRIAVEHWQDAADHGAVAGTAAAGVDAGWDGVPGFWTTIGDADVKYHAWGDGYQNSRMLLRDGGFTVWYERDGATVGVLTLNADDDYDMGERLIKDGAPVPVPMR